MSNDNDNELVISNNDFVILVSPTFKKDKWTGNVNINVAYPKNHDFTKETYDGIDFFVRMMIASLTLMEEHENIREVMYDYVSETWNLEDSKSNSRDVTIEYGEDNVINLTFNSDTEGNA